MADIGTMVNGLFLPLGLVGGLLGLFILFYLNALAVPTLPELFLVLIFTTQYGIDPLTLAILILIVATIGEAAGLLTLYALVKRVRVPQRWQRAFDRYQNFLLVHDERMILVNRVAPLLWFLGAFVALAHWDLRLSLTYQALGGLIKYGFILVLGGLFLTYTQQGTALWATLIIVAIMLALSFLISFRRRRGSKDRQADRPT